MLLTKSSIFSELSFLPNIVDRSFTIVDVSLQICCYAHQIDAITCVFADILHSVPDGPLSQRSPSAPPRKDIGGGKRVCSKPRWGRVYALDRTSSDAGELQRTNYSRDPTVLGSLPGVEERWDRDNSETPDAGTVLATTDVLTVVLADELNGSDLQGALTAAEIDELLVGWVEGWTDDSVRCTGTMALTTTVLSGPNRRYSTRKPRGPLRG